MGFFITLIAHGDALPQSAVNDTVALISSLKLNLGDIRKLNSKRAVDFEVDLDVKSLDDTQDLEEVVQSIRDALKAVQLQPGLGYDIVFQEDVGRKDRKLFVFDMDSTLIYQEVIELIAAYADVESQVAEITTRAMNGEIDFTESLASRVALLRGIESETLWEELKHKIEITNGASELCKGLKALGIKMAVLSGGFLPLARYVASELGLDYAYANNLQVEFENGKEILSGKTCGEIVDGAKKAELLKRIADENEIPYSKAVAVGDGANDLTMMSVAGFGVAWNAKPKVQQQAPGCLNSKSLKDLFYVLGYSDPEIEKLLG
ncbi:unnamed protein product [Kuraishia capsulata CBS 1993]|uniref:phosphoserine phosphatase n=1 Tax=Kuraishia capsulata CBS 1993 TaxID=1382522 RepID=W6MNZ6_9ASCO|nr:uncharacterized protein KUCA_T00004333001 [Kuraishia capsulata CBS 1993]CDK28351.1 unnamed protein product [Kuraishia capsulata CBS 1993]